MTDNTAHPLPKAAPESAGCRWPWLNCGAPAPCDVCGDAAPSPAEPSEYQLGYQQGRYDEQMAMGPPEEVFERGWNESPAPSEAVKGVSTAEPDANALKKARMEGIQAAYDAGMESLSAGRGVFYGIKQLLKEAHS